MGQQKINSVLELSKHKPGDILYWVVFRPVGSAGIKIPPDDHWIASCHPKVLYDRKLAKEWHYKNKLPRLCALDFEYVVDILTSEPLVERFEISSVCRSFDTGEFYYSNEEGEWMPESFLYQTIAGAKNEKKRIKNLFRTWANRMSEDEV